MRELSTIGQDVERSLEKAIYEVLLANGYIPNKTTYAANPAGYKTAQAAIVTAKGFCVEIFGHTSLEERGNLQVPRITITNLGYLPGSVGQDFGDQFEANVDGSFKKFNQGNPLSTGRFSIELWSNKANQDRLLEAVRQVALPTLTYINKWDNANQQYLVTYGFTASVPELTHGLIHKIYTYNVLDLVETNPNLVNPAIAKIVEIKVNDDTDDQNIITITD